MIELKNGKNKNPFEKHKTDYFLIKTNFDIDELTRITVFNQGAGAFFTGLWGGKFFFKLKIYLKN
jgi:hypothetical protein